MRETRQNVSIYLFRLYDFCSLHIHQLAHGVLDGVELAAVTRRVETVSVCLKKKKKHQRDVREWLKYTQIKKKKNQLHFHYKDSKE